MERLLRRHARVAVVGLGLGHVRGFLPPSHLRHLHRGRSGRQSNRRGSDARGGGAITTLARSLGSPALTQSQCATNRIREEVLRSVTRNTRCWSVASTRSRAIVRKRSVARTIPKKAHGRLDELVRKLDLGRVFVPGGLLLLRRRLHE